MFISFLGFITPLTLSEANAGWPLFRRGQDCPPTVCCPPSYEVCQPDVQVYQFAPASSACYSAMSCDETQNYSVISSTCSTVTRSAIVTESFSSSASIQQAIDRLDSVIGKLLQIQPNPEPSLKQLQDEIKKLQDEINKKTPISNRMKSDHLQIDPSVATEAMEPEREWTESNGQRTFLGTLLKINPSSVQILRNDGKKFDLSFSRLSLKDIAYLQSREDSKGSTLAMK